MKQYVKIFDEIKNTNSRIEKERLLEKYKDVDGFQEILKFVYDPLISTGLAKKKIEKKIDGEPIRKLNSIFEAMNFVKDNNTGTDKIIKTVQCFIESLESDKEKELAKSILIKDLPIGISKITLNKVYGKDFIKKYAVQLACKYEDGFKSLNGDFAVTLKLDGNRATVFTYESGIRIFARSGKEIKGLVELEKEFKHLPKNMVFDGEIIAKNPNNLLSKELFQLTQKIIRQKGDKKGLNFFIFDCLPISEFNNGISKKTYKERMADLDKIFNEYVKDSMHIHRVPTFYTGSDKKVIDDLLAKVVSQGYEGLMVNKLDGYYETKRTKSLLKVKKFYTADLRCIGVKEDIRGNKCGSITVDYKGYEVDVAGLKEDEKILFWKHPETVVGKIVEIKYFEETKNQDGSLSLRFPSFIRIRDDKDVVSYE
jgi:DNA ligase-1